MIDPRLFADDPELVRVSLRRRGAPAESFAAVERLVELNARRRALTTEGDRCRTLRNELSPRIGALMKAGATGEADALKAEVRLATERAGAIDTELVGVAAQEQDLLLGLPNLVDPSTPDGASDEDNPVVRTWGERTTFPFPARTHDDLGVALRLYDPERAAKLSGARFAVLSGGLAAMERALVSLFVDMATREHGYREVMVPYIVSRTTMTGTGQLPKFEEDLFRLTAEVSGEPAYLIPTAEVPVTNLHRDEILDDAALPVRYCAFTPCFRSEAGSYGRDTRGLVRQHQFHKVELVQIVRPEESLAALEALTGHAEAVLQRLELPYRVVARCTGDVGQGGAKGYDLEVWLPGQAAYREISSCTSFTEYQARRLKLRFKRDGEKKTTFLHTLNGSALAVGRTLVAILENYQEADGTVRIPAALRSYLGGLDRLTPGC